MTETCTVTSIWSIERKRGFSGGGGQLVPGVIARIVKTDGTLGGYNDVGELVVKAPSNALGYYNNAQAYVVSWHFTHPLNKIIPTARRKPSSMGNCNGLGRTLT